MLNDTNVLPSSEPDVKPHWICSLEDELGSLVWVTLRDDTFYVGLFKSFDQYGNIVITDAVKKIIVNEKKSFSDLYCGYTVIRGESISYFCAIDVVAYLKVFNYDGFADSEWVSRLEEMSKSKTTTVNITNFNSVLKYIALEEALQLAKEEREAECKKARAIDDIIANE
ncbi:conserved hypothetical protein [Theileria equi strain WA]|uniref:U6 snRNA-associated Sm-like protein LSm1 n=1 Tax=Theileria equi strain WA TaxID=1537102 RepID=L1LFN6_THEEQ|nr:conserved hypothetical protein [Theileria equi strain WA]EKX74084.1 conserved hypothetical protein [Theileria equi strain WA]|eukprot:XP_004833536.1 conserved hypothetical protein [Theileria equi strain WA]